MGMTQQLKNLCDLCLASVPDRELTERGGNLVCEACASTFRKSRPDSTSGPETVTLPAVEPMGFVAGFFADAKRWCHGRSGLGRVPILAFFAYVLVKHLQDPEYDSILGALNLGVHELGHFAFRPLGRFMTIAGGTILELAVPLVAVWMFRRQPDFFGIAVCFGWLSTACFDVATYAGDARSMSLPLVVPGMGFFPGGNEDAHDWHNMLSDLGLLNQDHTIALLFRCAAVVSMGVCLLYGSWLCWSMTKSRLGMETSHDVIGDEMLK